jgi:aryl-alcohol dehydrogenase-like predicted oxidoreductase
MATLGRTGARVSKLGFGAMELRRRLEAPAVEQLLHAVLDAGINVIDTAPDYGRSEEYIGRYLARRRDEYVLASKCGCPIGRPDPPPGQRREHFFDRANVRAGVEQSLRRMQTDHLDLVQFHNNPARSTLDQNDSVAELLALREEGKIRFLGMSGMLPHLLDHIAMGDFDVFQIPYSAIDRRHERAVGEAADAGAGTIIRGGVAQGLREPAQLDAASSAASRHGISPMEYMLRFAISRPDVHTVIVGTADVDHLAANVAAACAGDLPDVNEP